MSPWFASCFTIVGAFAAVVDDSLGHVQHDGCMAFGGQEGDLGEEQSHMSLLQTGLSKSHANILEESAPAKQAQGVVRQSVEVPTCSFSEGPSTLPPWPDKYAHVYTEFLQKVSQAGVVLVLLDGSLLGSYRHHGVIPFDEDLDAAFDVCANDQVINVSGSSLVGMSCSEMQALKDSIGAKKFHTKIWEEVLQPLVKDQGVYRSKRLSTDLTFWLTGDSARYGLRLTSNGEWGGGANGIGMDVKITVGKFPTSKLCRCPFGSVNSYCSVDSKSMLIEAYGEDFMVPKSQCDYYKEYKPYLQLSNRSDAECEWAKNLTAAT